VSRILELDLLPDEEEALQQSAASIRQNIELAERLIRSVAE
jgi:malate/lactate dehydrogenase